MQNVFDFFRSLGCTTPVDLISLCVGIVSIWYAITCNKAAKKVNKQASDTLLDMQYMMAFNLRAVCEIQNRLHQASNNVGMVYLPRDGVKLHKLSTYNKENANEVMGLLKKLAIKRHTLNSLQEFIESSETDRFADFFSSAETVDNSRLDDIVTELIKYGVLIDIYYN